MNHQEFQETLQRLRNKVNEARGVEKRARTELDQKVDAVVEKRKNYLHLKLEDDQLDKKQELHSVRRAHESARGADYLNRIEKESSEKLKLMDAVLTEMKDEKLDDIGLVATFYRAVRDIPNSFSDEAMSKKTMELDLKREATQKDIQEQKTEMEEEKAKNEAEAAQRKERNDSLDAFAKGLRTIIIGFEAESRCRKRVVQK